ncbi:hypothetical protein EV360DRAFT_69610 [Lentinula raphanica]|nr:hypothetical protein EV360DRAFT_69610 [Lentinula raphanica]
MFKTTAHSFLEDSSQTSDSMTALTPTISSPVSTIVGTAASISAVRLVEGPLTFTSLPLPSSVSADNNDHMFQLIFQPFIDFFEGPITLSRFSSQSSVTLVEGTVTLTPSLPLPTSSATLVEEMGTFTPSLPLPTSSVYTDNHMIDLLFQPFVDFFDGPIAVQQSSPTTVISAIVSNSVTPHPLFTPIDDAKVTSIVDASQGTVGVPSLTVALVSPISIAPVVPNHISMNPNAPFIVCIVTVATLALFVWPSLCAKRRRRKNISKTIEGQESTSGIFCAKGHLQFEEVVVWS